MVVLGIDPGTRRCGYGIVSRAGTRLTRLDSGVLVPGALPMAERLARILEGLGAILRAGRIDAVAVETAYFGLSARSALALGQARGVAIAAAASAGLPVFEFAPAEVKRAFTGSGRAEKAQMVRTAQAIFGIGARLADEADALAVAVCCLSRARQLAAPGARGPRGAPVRPGNGAVRPTGKDRLRPAVRRFAKA